MKQFVTVVAVGMFVFLFSSNAAAVQMGAGVKMGIGMSTLMGDGVKEMDTALNTGMRTGFAGYGVFSMDFSENFGAELNVGYAMKGKKYTDKESDKSYFVFQADYLEIPLLIKGMMPLGTVKPMLYAGPALGFQLSMKAKSHYEMAGFPVEDTTITAPDSTVNKVEFGLAFGTGAEVTMGPGALVFDIRYTLGLTSIAKATESEKKAPGYKESDYDIKTGTLGIMLGYIFKF